jgi:hypothetical protein
VRNLKDEKDVRNLKDEKDVRNLKDEYRQVGRAFSPT